MRSPKSALKVAAEARLQAVRVFQPARPNIGCHLQGTFYEPPDPGLNPGLVMYSRFAAKSAVPYGEDFVLDGSQAMNYLATIIAPLRDSHFCLGRLMQSRFPTA
jgi:hypothetical protein